MNSLATVTSSLQTGSSPGCNVVRLNLFEPYSCGPSEEAPVLGQHLQLMVRKYKHIEQCPAEILRSFFARRSLHRCCQLVYHDCP